MLYFAVTTPMNPRNRVIFLIVFAVPVVSLVIFGRIYHIPYALPEAGLLALFLGAIFIRILKARRPIEGARRRNINIAVKLYLVSMVLAVVDIIEEGWHWYELLYLIFPTLLSAVLFRSELFKKKPARSNR